jgi:hypothetical protein
LNEGRAWLIAGFRLLASPASAELLSAPKLPGATTTEDASLQAGHFNDFIEVGLLRAALYKAVKAAGADGLEHDVLVQRVFDALDLPLPLYASDPDVKYQALEQTRRALRSVLGYRLYRPAARLAYTSPNSSRRAARDCHLTDELRADEDVPKDRYPALVTATSATRRKVAKTSRLHAPRWRSSTPLRRRRNAWQSSQRPIPAVAIDERERLNAPGRSTTPTRPATAS